MIRKVIVKNFQSIKQAELELGQITVIVGESDQGKSAFVRAIRAWIENQSGTDFIRQGQLKCEVSAELEGGQTVSWTKSAKVNKYMIDEESFDKVGRGVPGKVQELVKMSPLMVEKEQIRINLKEQHDPPLMVSEGLPKLARLLGSIMGYGKLSKAVGLCRSDVALLQRDIADKQRRLKAVEEQLEQLEGIGALESEVQVLGDQFLQLKLLKQVLDNSPVDYSPAESLIRKLVKLAEVIRLVSQISTMKIVNTGELIEEVHELITVGQQIDLLLDALSMIVKCDAVESAIVKIVHESTIAVNELQQVVAGMETCPLCGQSVTSDHTQRIGEELSTEIVF